MNQWIDKSTIIDVSGENIEWFVQTSNTIFENQYEYFYFTDPSSNADLSNNNTEGNKSFICDEISGSRNFTVNKNDIKHVFTNNIQVYDITTNAWQTIETSDGSGRIMATSTILDWSSDDFIHLNDYPNTSCKRFNKVKKLFIFGGRWNEDGGECNEVIVYDLSDDVWDDPMEGMLRSGGSSFEYNEKVYFIDASNIQTYTPKLDEQLCAPSYKWDGAKCKWFKCNPCPILCQQPAVRKCNECSKFYADLRTKSSSEHMAVEVCAAAAGAAAFDYAAEKLEPNDISCNITDSSRIIFTIKTKYLAKEFARWGPRSGSIFLGAAPRLTRNGEGHPDGIKFISAAIDVQTWEYTYDTIDGSRNIFELTMPHCNQSSCCNKYKFLYGEKEFNINDVSLGLLTVGDREITLQATISLTQDADS